MSASKDYFRWRPHPWHGIPIGTNPPEIVNAYIEITPFDLIKYEIDKETGYLCVDRPQRTSSLPPTLYGFVPRTYCAKHVKELSPGAREGDGDPLDICVISERPISHSEVILSARVVGGIQTQDNGEADDKIVAVLENDPVWGKVNDISELPAVFIDRLRHYFSTYKIVPGRENSMHVLGTYDRKHAIQVVEAAIRDYEQSYGGRDEQTR